MAPLCYPKNQPFWDAPQGAQPHPSPKPCKAQWSMVQKPTYKLLHPANGNWAKWWCPPSSDQSRAIEAEVGQFILNNFDSRCVFPMFIAVYNNVCISHMFITFILKNEHNIIIFILGICREREIFTVIHIFDTSLHTWEWECKIMFWSKTSTHLRYVVALFWGLPLHEVSVLYNGLRPSLQPFALAAVHVCGRKRRVERRTCS